MATELIVNDKPIALRQWGGKDRGVIVTMLVTKDEWNAVKNSMANTDRFEFDVATAEMIVKDWISLGASVIWKGAADWNKEARELEQHRFRDEVPGFDTHIQTAKDNARSTMRSTLKTIK